MTEFKSRPTLYQGIRMRSRLEADYAAALDRSGTRWEYEPECFAGEEGQWLPDFRGWLDDNPPDCTEFLVEVKPAGMLDQRAGEDLFDVIARVDQILHRMTVAWLSAPDVTLELVFWTYGAGMPDLAVIANQRNRCGWQARVPAIPLPFMWAGMGQMQAITHPATSRTAA